MEISRSEIVEVGVNVFGMIDGVSPTTTQRKLVMIEPLSSPEYSDIFCKKGSFRQDTMVQTITPSFGKGS